MRVPLPCPLLPCHTHTPAHRSIHESPLFQQQTDSSLAPNCPHVQEQINQQLSQFKGAASEVCTPCVLRAWPLCSTLCPLPARLTLDALPPPARFLHVLARHTIPA